MNRNANSGGMGMSLLLLVFFVLALSLFAALTLSTAKNSLIRSEELAAKKDEYYLAVSKAEQLLSQADGILASAYEKAENGDAYFKMLAQELSSFENAEYCEEKAELSFTVKINGRQSLYILLDLAYPSAGDTFYTVRAFKSVSDVSFNADNGLNLISFDN